jgi:hypothetical protein
MVDLRVEDEATGRFPVPVKGTKGALLVKGNHTYDGDNIVIDRGTDHTYDRLATVAALVAVAPDGEANRLRTIADASPGLGGLLVGSRTPGASEPTGARLVTASNSAVPAKMIDCSSGKRIRVLAANIFNISSTANHFELYYGTQSTLDGDVTKLILNVYLDTIDQPSISVVFPDEGAPVGAVDEDVYIRTSSDITTNGVFSAIYREE